MAKLNLVFGFTQESPLKFVHCIWNTMFVYQHINSVIRTDVYHNGTFPYILVVTFHHDLAIAWKPPSCCVDCDFKTLSVTPITSVYIVIRIICAPFYSLSYSPLPCHVLTITFFLYILTWLRFGVVHETDWHYLIWLNMGSTISKRFRMFGILVVSTSVEISKKFGSSDQVCVVYVDNCFRYNLFHAYSRLRKRVFEPVPFLS